MLGLLLHELCLMHAPCLGFLVQWSLILSPTCGPIAPLNLYVPIAALSTIQTIHATTRHDQFLMKLRPEYESVRSSLLNRSHVPSLDICFGELLCEEQHLITQAILEQSHATSAAHDSPSTTCSVPAPPAPDYCTPEMVQWMLISALSAMRFQGNSSTKLWYVDSGASNHMTNNPTALCHVWPYTGQSSIQTANDSSLPIVAIDDASSKFTDDQVTGEPIAKGPKVGRLFPLFLPVPDFSPLSSIKSFACNNVSDLSMVWHRRLGHPNTQILSHVLNSDLPGNKDRFSLSLECDSCKLGKSKTLIFPLHTSKASHYFDLIHSDVWGPSPTLCTDFDGEYLSTELQAFLVSKGIIHQRSCPSTPQQNGVVERKNRHLLDVFSDLHPISSRFQPAFTTALSNFDIPTCYSHTAKHDCWRQAMQEEIAALEANHTWDIEPCPPTIVSLGCKWIYLVKVRSDGSLDRYKARLVALGNNQEYGVNYEDTFAPEAKMTTVRTILTLAASSDWPLHQMDSKYDTSLFLRKSDMSIVVLLVYVDDIVITGSNSALLGQLKIHLSESFHMKDLGSLTYFLGLEVHHSPSGISLNQHKYVSALVATAGLQGATSVDTPMELNVKLRKEESDLLAYPSLYRKLVGSLVYLTITRPNISFAVQQVSQFLQTHRHLHLVVVHRIIRYVQGTSTRGLFFPVDNSTRLAAYSDADWAGCADTRRSITDFSEIDPTPLHADNTSAIKITTNPIYHERTKHIEVDCHSIREVFETHVITLPHISTDLQIVDLFTKALPRHRHCLLSSKLMLVDQPASI
ncbi:Retrovirus-related Pol polyprotein from transposon RE2 [Vitis vinifera]|uniref:Retrovirus-related Pol polyprotein from transposon RE2 n=1 Tax=Vitis vinifera TaxID=29760 RepID=A0A438FHX2_VITVI|nr:Retrovirus-related Pol polyprotein from transposon RE2 [Vitis vinifera]